MPETSRTRAGMFSSIEKGAEAAARTVSVAKKHFAKRPSEVPFEAAPVVLDEKTGLPASVVTPAPIPTTNPVAEIKVATPKKKAATDEAAPAGDLSDAKAKLLGIRTRFSTKKKPAAATEAPARAETVAKDAAQAEAADPFAASQTSEAIPDAVAESAPIGDAAVNADTITATGDTESGEKKKGLARIFSLQRRRAVDSSSPSDVASEPKPEGAEPAATEPTVAAQPPATPETEVAPTPATPPTEAETKRAGWKRLRLARSKSGNVIETVEEPKHGGAPTAIEPATEAAPVEAPAADAPVIDTPAAETSSVVKDGKKPFWAWAVRKHAHADVKPEEPKPEAVETEAAVPATAEVVAEPTAAEAEVAKEPSTEEAKPAADDSKAVPVVWKRLISIRKKPEDKKVEAGEVEAADPVDAAAPDAPAAEAPVAVATAEPAADVATEAKSERKGGIGFKGIFAPRKPTAEVEATPAATPETDAEAEAPKEGAMTEGKIEELTEPAAEPETPENKGLYRAWSDRRKSAQLAASPAAVASAEEVETVVIAAEEPKPDSKPASTESPEKPGLYRLFSGRRKPEPKPVVEVAPEAEAVVVEDKVEEVKEVKSEPVTETSEVDAKGLHRLFSISGRRMLSAVEPLVAAPVVESAEASTSQGETTAPAQEEHAPAPRKRLNFRKKSTTPPATESETPDATDAVAAASAEAMAEGKTDDKKASAIDCILSLVRMTSREKGEGPQVAEGAEPVKKKADETAELKPSVLARVASALSPTPKKTLPAETPAEPAIEPVVPSDDAKVLTESTPVPTGSATEAAPAPAVAATSAPADVKA